MSKQYGVVNIRTFNIRQQAA